MFTHIKQHTTVGAALGKLADEFTTQVIRPQAAELAQATRGAADTFKEAAEYGAEWAAATTVPLLDQLWIYSGILSRVPQLIETAEQTSQKIKTNYSKRHYLNALPLHRKYNI